MKLNTSIVLTFFLFSTMAAFQEEDNIMVLTKDTFQDAIYQFKFIMCGHCKELAHEYSTAAIELKKAGDRYIPLAKVNAIAEPTIAGKFAIREYPTLKFFINGKAVDYDGGETTIEIINWVLKKSGTLSIELQSVDQLTAYIEKTSTIPIVVFFGTTDDDNDFITFKNVAQTNNKVMFLHIFSEQAREKHSVTGKVVLFNDEKRNHFSNKFTSMALEAFINANANPELLPYNDKAINVIFQQERNNALFLFTDDTEAGIEAFNQFAKVADIFKDKIKFSYSSANDRYGMFHRLAKYFEISTTSVPKILLFDQEGGNGKYIFNGEMTSDNIKKFVEDFYAGKLTRYLKSQEIPATNNEPVKILVGKNFDSLVMNNDKDVLVQFYAPFCGHCKQLAPIYEILAKKLQVNPNIIFAKCDGTVNEIAAVHVESFPTFKFFKSGQKDKVISCNDCEDEAAFLEFLKQNTSHPWIDLDIAQEL